MGCFVHESESIHRISYNVNGHIKIFIYYHQLYGWCAFVAS